jgi:hypothetical protein
LGGNCIAGFSIHCCHSGRRVNWAFARFPLVAAGHGKSPDETLKPVKKNLRFAVGDSPEGPFGPASAPFTPSWVEGPSAIRIGDEYIVFFDCYQDHHYGAVRSRNLKEWEDVTSRLTFPKGARHGTVLRVPKSVVDGLSEAHPSTR